MNAQATSGDALLWARGLERRLFDLLKGTTSRGDFPIWSSAWGEQLAEGAEGLAHLADLLVHERHLGARVQAAVSAERDPLVLQDGSTLDMLYARERLVEKESRAPFFALRELIGEREGKAVPPGWAATVRDERAALGPLSSSKAEAVAFFLTEAGELRAPMWDVLASEAGHAADDGARLARAADPTHPWFSLEGARQALRPLRTAAARHGGARTVSRVAAPWGLAGEAACLEATQTRWLAGEARRGQGYRRLVCSGATALLAAQVPPATSEDEDRWTRALGHAASFALWKGPILGAADATTVDRLCRAVWFFEFWTRATLAQVWRDEGPEPDAWRDALGVSGGFCREQLRWGWSTEWPGRLHPRLAGAALEVATEEAVRAVYLHRALRELFDESWPCAPDLLRTLAAEGSVCLALHSLGLDLESPLAPLALVDWLSEMV